MQKNKLSLICYNALWNLVIHICAFNLCCMELYGTLYQPYIHHTIKLSSFFLTNYRASLLKSILFYDQEYIAIDLRLIRLFHFHIHLLNKKIHKYSIQFEKKML